MAKTNFSDLGRVEAISSLYEGTPYKPFSGCWFESKGDGFITTVSKNFLEGTDFNLVYFPLKHLGYKCVVAATAELYAEMAHPKVMDIVLGVSSKLDYDHIVELWSGMVTAAKEHGYSQVGLDLVPSVNGLSISISATGETSKLMASRRPIAKSKDLICVSGSLGGAFFGMQVLERERRKFDEKKENMDQKALEKYKMMVGDYLKPEINAKTISQLEETGIIPSFGYVVNRGLADAVKRLVRDSGLGAKVYADKIPFEGNSFDLGKELDIDPVSAAMNGGEDYRLLFTIPILSMEKFRHDFQTFDIIGHLALPEAGAAVVLPDGVELPLKSQGWKEQEQ